MTNEEATQEIVRSVLDEMLGTILHPIVKDAVASRITGCLAEVELIAEDS